MAKQALRVDSEKAAFEKAHEQVRRLAVAFKSHESYYLSPQYSEAQARIDFIDKLFMALDWDVTHDKQINPYRQEVKVERPVSVSPIGPAHRRADYAFYIDPNYNDPRFFVEAKKPHGDIATRDNYFQTIRYSYGKNLKLSVLTDFEQFHIIDCRQNPDALDSVLDSAVCKFHYSEYEEKEQFAKIYYLFSRGAVADGSIDDYAENLQPRQGYRPVDEAFLEVLDKYRLILAKEFKKADPRLDSETLTELTQRTLDRLVFMRFLEDKLIHPDSLVEKVAASNSPWRTFVTTCLRIDGIYNGIIFRRHAVLDALDFKPSDRVFAEVCRQLSDPNSLYDFNAIPIHILGSIYERFLGKIILTNGDGVELEEKPEVRKAGGVYYTPEYIVRYIAESTVGKLIAGKTPGQIAELRFADIACGSGSFLLGAYDEVLRYEREWYNAHPDKAKKAGCIKLDDGAWHLSLKQKREILVNNIYGVDIDRQAVEVAQLSLYLKLLEEETMFSAKRHQLEFHETLLPSLGKNIVCGNSLVGPDFSDKTEDLVRVRALDWQTQFPSILARGGFDAVIGNPPYVRQETISDSKSYYMSHYEAYDGGADLFAYLIERGVKLLRLGGLFSVIVSASFLRASYGAPLRRVLKKYASVRRVVDFGGLAVFAAAKDTYVCIPLLERGGKPAKVHVAKVPRLNIPNLAAYVASHRYAIPPDRLTEEAWSLQSDVEAALLAKLMKRGRPLGEYVGRKMFFRGLLTGLNKAFVLSREQRDALLAADSTSHRLIHPHLGGQDIRRYEIRDEKYLLAIPCGYTIKQMAPGKAHPTEKEAWAWLKRHHGAITRHLEPFADALRKRGDKGDFWWELRPCDYYDALDAPKIIFPDICKGPRFYPDDTGIYIANTAYCLGTGDRYLLGFLNSRLFWFAIASISIPFGVRAGQFRYRLFYQYMEKVPVRHIDQANRSDRAAHDRIVANVEQMLTLHRQRAAARSAKEQACLDRQIGATDALIDRDLYTLYGLTQKEIELVEANSVAVVNDE